MVFLDTEVHWAIDRANLSVVEFIGKANAELKFTLLVVICAKTHLFFLSLYFIEKNCSL
jgi:hypothetical protein